MTHIGAIYLYLSLFSGGSNKSSKEASDNITQLDSKTLRVGLFQIDLDVVTVKGLIQMRRILPKAEYRLIKNRKCARVSRQKRKDVQMTLVQRLDKLEAENKNLRIRLMNLECQRSVEAHNSSLSSFEPSSDDVSCHTGSAQSAPQGNATTWRAERVTQTESRSNEGRQAAAE